MQCIEHWPSDVPMKIVGFEVQRIGVSQQARKSLSDRFPRFRFETDINSRSCCCDRQRCFFFLTHGRYLLLNRSFLLVVYHIVPVVIMTMSYSYGFDLSRLVYRFAVEVSLSSSRRIFL